MRKEGGRGGGVNSKVANARWAQGKGDRRTDKQTDRKESEEEGKKVSERRPVS